MPRPILEYEAPDQKVVEGAVFAHADGTNPSLLVLIQLVEREGERQWMFAPVRMTSAGISLKHKEKEIWTDEHHPRSGDYDSWTYFFTVRDPEIQ